MLIPSQNPSYHQMTGYTPCSHSLNVRIGALATSSHVLGKTTEAGARLNHIIRLQMYNAKLFVGIYIPLPE